MSFGITSSGLVKKTYTEIKAELEAGFRAAWPTIDLDYTGPAGQLIAQIAKGYADLWDRLQGNYSVLNPNEASDASLDNCYTLLKLTRIDSSPTRVLRVAHWGDNATTIPAGSQVKQGSTGTLFTLDADVVLASANPRFVDLTLTTPTNGMVFAITIDGIVYSVTAGSTSTKDTIGAQLVTAIGSRASFASDVLSLDGGDSNMTISALGNLAVSRFANAGDYTCTEDSPLAVPQTTLGTIMTPVSGWTSVSNPDAGVTGRVAETDTEFRSRAATYFLYGKGTEEGIRQYLLNVVAGIQTAAIRSNRTGLTVGDMPPNSFEVIVQGGLDADIADALWLASPIGIEIYGLTSVVVTDSQGFNHTVKFTRPGTALVWIKVQRTLDPEYPYPVDGDAQIKNAIVAWAAGQYTAGKDVYPRAVMTPINTIPGLGDVTVLIGNSVTSTPPTVYAESKLVIPYSSTAEFSLDRIIVEAV